MGAAAGSDMATTTTAFVPWDWREGRRFRAWELKQQGWTQRLIAAALGVTPRAVSQWMTRVREVGIDGLRRRIAPGRQPKLTAEQVAQLPGLLAQGAAAWGFLDEVWTTPRIAAVIEQGFWDALPSGAPQSAAAGDWLESPEADAA